MNPTDQNYGAGADAANQADRIQKQMAAEEAAAMPEAPVTDNSILADFDAESKSLSDIIHEGASDPAQNNTNTAGPTNETPKKEKKPVDKKMIVIIVGAVLGVGIVALVIWLIVGVLIPNLSVDSGGAKADPDRKAFFVADSKDDSLFAVYNDKGEKLTGFIYKKESENFNSKGYAVVKHKSEDKYAIMTNTGRLSVPFDKYEDITELGSFFVATDYDGSYLIDGSGEKIESSDSTEARHSLFLNYDGSESHIYDKYGNLVGKNRDKHALSLAKPINNTICVQLDAKVNCFDANTGEKVFTVENSDFADNDITIWSTNITPNRGCAIFTNRATGDYYPYFHGKLGKYSKMAGVNATDSYRGVSGCYFTDNKMVMGGDFEEVSIAELGAKYSFDVAILDKTHYAYSLEGHKGGVIRIGEEIKTIDSDKKVYVSTGVDYISVKVDRMLYFYRDSLKPFFEAQIDSDTAIILKDVYSTSDIDENGNVIVEDMLFTKDGKKLYSTSEYGHLEYLNGAYYFRTSQGSEKPYIAIIGKDGKEYVAPNTYVELKPVGKLTSFKKADGTSGVLDTSFKEVLSGYEGVSVFDSHIEATKDNKVEYYTLDLKKVN